MTRSGALDLVPPAFHWMPEYGATLGDEVADLAVLAGFAADPEQRLALDMLFALGPTGKAAVRDLAVVAPRQNLKTGFLKQAALGWLFITEQRLVVWSAHEFSTSQEAFRDMAQLIESCPDLDREVQQIHYGNGEESIELTGDRRLKFKARTKAGGRGLTGDKIVLDEAMYLRPSHMGALVPTLRAVKDPQLILAGSAGMADSDVWRSYRIRGRAGGDPSLGFLEYCDPEPGGCKLDPCHHRVGAPGCALDDRARWWGCNTALGRRITEDTLASDRRSLPPEEFARETLGWWEDPPSLDGGGDLDLQRWLTLADAGAPLAKPLVLGVDQGEDRLVSIGCAWRRPDQQAQLMLAQDEDVDVALAPALAVSRLIELHRRHGARVLLGGPAVGLELELRAAGVPTETVSGTEFATACGHLDDRLRDGGLRHGNQAELNESIAVVRWRSVGTAGERAFVLKNAVGVSPAAAVVRALHGLTAGGPPAPAPITDAPTSAGASETAFLSSVAF